MPHRDCVLHVMGCTVIGEKIRNELNETIAQVLRVKQSTALLSSADDAVVHRSISSRHPYIDPLNLLQTNLLHKYRHGANDERTLDAIAVTIQGMHTCTFSRARACYYCANNGLT